MPTAAQKLAAVEAEVAQMLGFKRDDNPEAFDLAVRNLQESKGNAGLTQPLSDLKLANEHTGELVSLEEYVARLTADASQAGVSIPDVVSQVKELTERMVPLSVAFPKLTDVQVQVMERKLLQGCTKKAGNRLPDAPPVYFNQEYGGLIAVVTKDGKCAVVWREHDKDVPLSDGSGTYPVFTIVGIALGLDVAETRAMMKDAMAAKRALFHELTDGYGDIGTGPFDGDDVEAPF